jgi:hypothetical protein
MENKTEKLIKPLTDLKNKIQGERSIQTNLISEAYLEINKTSFKQNFNFLIGHFKEGGRAPRVG